MTALLMFDAFNCSVPRKRRLPGTAELTQVVVVCLGSCLVDRVRRAQFREAVRHGLAPLRALGLLELGRHLFGVVLAIALASPE